MESLTSSSWWEEINESTEWQDGIFFTLSATYSLLSAVALIQLIRIELRVPEFGWTTQKVFHFMNFIVNGVRAVVFGFHMFVFALKPKVLTLLLLDFPGLLFFTTYTLLVLFWAEIYYQARSLPTDKLRTWYISVNCVIYVIQLCPLLQHLVSYYTVEGCFLCCDASPLNRRDEERNFMRLDQLLQFVSPVFSFVALWLYYLPAMLMHPSKSWIIQFWISYTTWSLRYSLQHLSYLSSESFLQNEYQANTILANTIQSVELRLLPSPSISFTRLELNFGFDLSYILFGLLVE